MDAASGAAWGLLAAVVASALHRLADPLVVELEPATRRVARVRDAQETLAAAAWAGTLLE
jgi:hypothetical protein